MNILLFVLAISGWDYGHWIICNKDSMSADWTNSILRVKWKSIVTTPAHFAHKVRVYDNDGTTQLWVDAESDSDIWVLKPTFDKDGDSVLIVDSTAGTGFSMDSSQMVFDSSVYHGVFHFSEKTGDTIFDATYWNLKGVISGTPNDTIGMVGRCRWFNRSDEYYRITDNGGLDLGTGDISYFSIINFTNTGVNEHWIGTSVWGAGEISLQKQSDNGLYFYFGHGANYCYDYSATNNTWYIMTQVRTAGVSLKTYRNGLDMTDGVSGATNADIFCTYLDIGRDPSQAYYGGFIDEVRFLKSAMTANQIKNANYNIVSPTTWWTVRAEISANPPPPTTTKRKIIRHRGAW